MILGYYEKEMVFLKRIFKQFRYRKMVLAAADAFIIAYDRLVAEGYKFVTVSEMLGLEGKDASGYAFSKPFRPTVSMMP